jgi:hypothetical protein
MADNENESRPQARVEDALEEENQRTGEGNFNMRQSETSGNGSTVRGPKRQKVDSLPPANIPHGGTKPSVQSSASSALGQVIASVKSSNGAPHAPNANSGVADQTTQIHETRLGRQPTLYSGMQRPMVRAPMLYFSVSQGTKTLHVPKSTGTMETILEKVHNKFSGKAHQVHHCQRAWS